MTTLTISLPESLKKFVDQQTQSQGYENISEYFLSLLNDAQSRANEKELETLLLKGLSSGKDLAANPEFWKKLKAEASILSQKRNS